MFQYVMIREPSAYKDNRKPNVYQECLIQLQRQ